MAHPFGHRIASDKIEERRYQIAIAGKCLEENTLVILPTGLGKTVVAAYAASAILEKGKKVMILAPTKPLVDQHSSVFSEFLRNTEIGVMNGLMSPANRIKTIERCDLAVSTPQTVANDLREGRYNLEKFGLIIYDEAHRGTGNYAYVEVAEHCPPGIMSMGLTASPGSDVGRVEEVCRNLSLTSIEIRSEEDPDVSPYVHDTYVKKIYVNMPEELLSVISSFRKMLDHYFGELVQLRIADPNWPPSTKHMLMIGENLRRRLDRDEKTAIVYRGLTVQAICVKLLHAIGMAETQGMSALRNYMSKLNEEYKPSDSKSSRELIGRKEYLEAWAVVRDTKVEHPKVSKIMSLVSQIINSGGSSKVMVFTQYRDTCDMLAEKLSSIPGAKAAKLIGQSNGGLKQKEQIKVLDDFRNGAYNIILSTSVGEEGLDITSTDAVIFYEPVPSEIRTIQRRGRTGRKNDGEVFVLIAKDTMDEVFENTSKNREEAMRSRLENLNRTLKKNALRNKADGQTRIGEF